jgi:hypothetical protein
VALAALLLMVATAGTTAAAVVREYDTVGDASPAYDIRWAKYDNGTMLVSYTVKVRDLRRETEIRGVMVDREHGTVTYVVGVWKRVGKPGFRTELIEAWGSGITYTVPCAITLKWSWAHNRVRLSFPRSCLSTAPGTLSMSASTEPRSERGGLLRDWSPSAEVEQG